MKTIAELAVNMRVGSFMITLTHELDVNVSGFKVT
jgi:hypothetical protein